MPTAAAPADRRTISPVSRFCVVTINGEDACDRLENQEGAATMVTSAHKVRGQAGVALLSLKQMKVPG